MPSSKPKLHRVIEFIDPEVGDDLIVSFVMRHSAVPMDVESVILMRTPMFEHLVPEWERGVTVSLDGDDEDADDYLECFAYDRAAKIVRLTTTNREFELDLRKVEESELEEMVQVIRKMNFDYQLQVSGACPREGCETKFFKAGAQTISWET